jgi:hypothetical protein
LKKYFHKKLSHRHGNYLYGRDEKKNMKSFIMDAIPIKKTENDLLHSIWFGILNRKKSIIFPDT